MPQTTQWGLPYPTLSDVPNVPLDLQKLAVAADAGLNQSAYVYPGTQTEDIKLASGIQTIVNWTFAVPSNWQSATVMFHWAARQWANVGSHIRTLYTVALNGAQLGPQMVQSSYVASGSYTYANMISANRLFGNLNAGTHRVTVTGQIELGASQSASIGSQFWFVTLSRVR